MIAQHAYAVRLGLTASSCIHSVASHYRLFSKAQITQAVNYHANKQNLGYRCDNAVTNGQIFHMFGLHRHGFIITARQGSVQRARRSKPAHKDRGFSSTSYFLLCLIVCWHFQSNVYHCSRKTTGKEQHLRARIDLPYIGACMT